MFPILDQTSRPSIGPGVFEGTPSNVLVNKSSIATACFDEKILYRGCFLTICIHFPHLFALNLSPRPATAIPVLASIVLCGMRYERAHVTAHELAGEFN